MIRRILSVILGLGIASGLLLASAWADPGQVPPEDPHCRAGHPQEVAPWAVPAASPSQVGYYVGGGSPCPHLADPRCLNEGTWGWDYQGCLFFRKVTLGWWHGRRYQGGIEGYKVDGPRRESKEPGHE